MARRLIALLALLVSVASVAACAPDEPPNVVVVVVDTLRADRMGIYGHRRATTPRIDATLAQRGVVVEDARTQAPWTLPSMASMLAGRWPGEVVGAELASMGIPEHETTLAEALQTLGYRTAAFVGNPTMHEGAGFAQGFDVYSLPESRRAMEFEHAEDVDARLSPWLDDAFQSRGFTPFFLFVHYIDPHDPYDNDRLVDGNSPYDPGYDGRLSGGDIHGLHLGTVELDDPRRDVRHLSALYDSEIRYVDRFVGRLVERVVERFPNTLFVLTSDHGEELYDHGGWKHGRTLYEEQLHVPLALRWDGVLPAGTRDDGSARLLDVAPTLVAAAGGTPPDGWAGDDLTPWLRGDRSPSSREIFSQHYSHGPTRATAVDAGWKLILFDRRRRFDPDSEQQRLHYREAMARLDRIELYDLERDPGERTDLADERPEMTRRLEPIIHQRLGRELPGLRLLSVGVPTGETVTGEIAFERPVESWSSYFLGPDDRIERSASSLRFELTGEALTKGVRFPSPAFGRIVRVSARLVDSGEEVPVVGSDGRTLDPPTALDSRPVSGWPPAVADANGPAVVLWSPVPSGRDDDREPNAETLRRLEALGYVD